MQPRSFGSDPARSWTDIFLNHTYISSIRRGFNPRDIQEGKVPPYCLPEFLHEACHHWCLLSPVGSAWSAVQYRTWQLAQKNDPESVAFFLEYHLRLEVISTLFNPILEGLALLYEYDVVPGDSRTVSLPMQLAAIFFLRSDFDKSETKDIWYELFRALDERRRHIDYIEEKTELLSSPLISPEGYLSGYMMAKYFCTMASYSTRLGVDRDLVASFMRWYFFHDYELVSFLLRAPLGAESVFPLVNHLQKRLLAICHIDDLNANLEKFEAEALRVEKTVDDNEYIDQDAPAYGTDPERSREGKRLLKELCDSMDPGVAFHLARRRFLHLISYPVSVEFFEEERFLTADENGPLLAGKSSRPWPRGTKTEGSVEVLYDTFLHVQVLAVSIGREIIHKTMKGSEKGKAILEGQFGQYWISRQLLIKDAESMRLAVRERITAVEKEESARAIRKHLLNIRDDLYASLALAWVPIAKRRESVRILGSAGFGSIYNEKLLESLAVLSMVDVYYAHLEEVFSYDPSIVFQSDCDEIERIGRESLGSSPIRRIQEKDGAKIGTRVLSFV